MKPFPGVVELELVFLCQFVWLAQLRSRLHVHLPVDRNLQQQQRSWRRLWVEAPCWADAGLPPCTPVRLPILLDLVALSWASGYKLQLLFCNNQIQKRARVSPTANVCHTPTLLQGQCLARGHRGRRKEGLSCCSQISSAGPNKPDILTFDLWKITICRRVSSSHHWQVKLLFIWKWLLDGLFLGIFRLSGFAFSGFVMGWCQ